MAESGSHQKTAGTKDQQVIEVSEDSENEDIDSDSENHKPKAHNEKQLEQKMSKIQEKILKSSVFGSKIQDSKIVKIEHEMMAKIEAIEE